MGYSKSKTHERETISGHHVAIDIQSGTHGAEDLAARNEARQKQINEAHRADWPKDMLTASKEDGNPIMANAMSRQPRPSDAVVGSANRYGAGQEAPPKKGGPVQKPAAKVGGIQRAETNRG